MPGIKRDYKEDIERATAVFETSLGTFEVELFCLKLNFFIRS